MSTFTNIRDRLWGNAQYKFSIIFCSLYTVIFYGKTFNSSILWYILISILLSIGIAGIGYALNDLYDYKDDIINKKQNIFLYFNTFQSILLVTVFAILSIFPWFILPFNRYSFILLMIEFLLFLLYALPPIRLKEHGFIGVLTDALYAQVVPCLLAVYTYSMIVNGVTLHLFILIPFLLWLILSGCRNIIHHQIEDFVNDKNTNTHTFATCYGISTAQKIVLYIIAPIEIIAFIVLLYHLPHFRFVLCAIYFLFVIIYMIVFYLKSNHTLFYNQKELYQFLNQKILNEFYEIHLPVLLLAFFSFYNPFFIWILLLNLLLFVPIYYSYTIGFFKKYF
ncbi:MAG: UbiA family prenyltransferase [Chitinophagales bacterium]|nr:UbiA family prenyltransferase [Chitinophagales bacterium]